MHLVHTQRETMSSKNTTFSLRTNQIAFGFVLCTYVFFGLYTHSIFLNTRPSYDFALYERALSRALSSLDPYDIRDIGPAFLYPPPSLFAIEALSMTPNESLQFYVVLSVNLVATLFIIRQIYSRFGYNVRDVWFWFPIAFFFAPFLATLQVGQINLITELGIVIFFMAAIPWLAALGLTLAVITKVTPLAFLFYSFVGRDRKTIFYSLILIIAVILAAGFRYGFSTYTAYIDVFADLLQTTGLTQNSQSFESKVWMTFQPDFSPALFHTVFLLYMGMLVLVSGCFAARADDRVPLFIVLGLAITVSPNVMWYHHYVFLLHPLLIWMAWQKLERGLVLWIMSGLLIIQIDYYFLTTGFLIHLFVQLSILRVIYQQYSTLREMRQTTAQPAV